MNLILAVLPVILIAIYIYNKDMNKEPSKLLAKLFFSGIISTIITIFLTIILGLFIPNINVDNVKELSGINLIIHAFIGVGLIEEFSKWIMIYTISYNNEEFDELYDIILYSVYVSLGFACLENLLYVADGGLITAIIRAILSIPGHTCLGIYMGYYLGLAKTNELNKKYSSQIKFLLLSIIIPTILHGFYDYCLFTQKPLFILIYFIFICFLYIHAYKKIIIASNVIQKLKYKNNYCTNCGTAVNSNYCPICGKKNE